MTLSGALNNSVTGLNATSLQLDIAANNLSNATTEGYRRREIELASISLNNRGAGVRVSSVTVAQVESITNDRRRSEAEFARQSTMAENLKLVEDLVGGVDDPGSFFKRYEAFEASLRDLADAPESTVAQSSTLINAQNIVDGFNLAQEGLIKIREDVDAEIARQVELLNDSLAELDELNKQVRSDLATGLDAAEPIAQRQTVIDRISEIVPIRTRLQDDGTLQASTIGGAALIDLSAGEYTFTAQQPITADMDYRNGVGSLSGLVAGGIEVTPGVASYGGMTGGSLEALFEVRDGLTVEFQAQLDALASDLIDRFDDAAVDPTITPGDPGLFTDAGGADSGLPGLAGRLEINAAVDPDQGGELYRLRDGIGATAEGVVGDNTVPVALLDAFTAAKTPPADTGLTGLLGSTEMVADLTTLLTSNTELAETAQAARAARYDSLMKAETIAVGVDVDYELQNLVLLEKAYAANAQVIRVVDELFDLLLQR